ncbi:MAG TPA: glycosyltransferase family 39 protein [Candidatus Nitrosotalea sp.]|nr:glycosyltransferase family 39 protein [Candidatus Nitrosotalea sp.]
MLRTIQNRKYLVLIIILTFSAFTHLWNAVEFPDIFFDEGVYMRRAMHILSGQGPQEGWFYDHPFFGQIFLSSILGLTGYPTSLHPSTNPLSISTLYLEPRIIMGMLAIVDTFLIYKIAENRYGPKIALISSMLFAVMPYTWIVRRILLDSILLPFLLMSIYLALYSKNSKHQEIIVLLSGTCLGLAIFTKVLIFVFIPLIVGLIYFYNNKKTKLAILWFIPVLIIPSLWPIYSVDVGQFEFWVKGIIYQTHRFSAGLPFISHLFLEMDPVLFILGIAGTGYSILRRDWFILWWFVPFVIFLFAIGYDQYFYWIPILPVFCISAGKLIVNLLEKIRHSTLKRVFSLAVIFGIGTFGFVSTLMIITTDMSDSQFEAASYVLQNIKSDDHNTTILASPTYSWIFNYVFHRSNVLIDYSDILFSPLGTSKVVLVADTHFMLDINRGPQLQQIYNKTITVATFEGDANKYDSRFYPYDNLWVTPEGSHIEIKEK